MKSRPLAYLFVLSLALNAGVLGTLAYRHFTAPPPMSAGCPPSSSDRHMYQLLGLSAEQLALMKPIADSFHAGQKELRASAGEQRDALLALLVQEPLDIPRIQEAGGELAARQAKVQGAVTAHILDVRRILTPPQQKRFFRLMRQAMCETAR